jgi:hypothetical protein
MKHALLFLGIIGVALVFVFGKGWYLTATGEQTVSAAVTVEPAPQVLFKKVEVGLNESKMVSQVELSPQTLLEDSRCPVDVSCIQAGTVRVRTKLTFNDGYITERTFSLGKPILVQGVTVTLTSAVKEEKNNSTDYRFGFIATD